jgi:hypothetical protein
MDLTSILVIVNICVSAVSPIFQMFNRVKKSECLGAKLEMGTPTKSQSNEDLPAPLKHGK